MEREQSAKTQGVDGGRHGALNLKQDLASLDRMEKNPGEMRTWGRLSVVQAGIPPRRVIHLTANHLTFLLLGRVQDCRLKCATYCETVISTSTGSSTYAVEY